MITTLAGGVGAARLLRGLVAAAPDELVAVANVGDDLRLHGLHVSPDLDTITYTLADAVDPETGWGLRGETWQAMEALERYGGVTWFRLGDRDLATHLFRTARLDEGASLTEVTGEIAAAWNLPIRLLPVTDDPLRTMVTRTDGQEIAFQDYFVRLQHDVDVARVRFAGAEASRPGPEVLSKIADADVLVVAPSNPLVSIDPLLAVPGIREAVTSRRERNVAVSPIVAGAAIKGPAARLMTDLGLEPTVVGIARYYRDLVGTLVIDEQDRDHRDDVEAEGVRAVVCDTIMATDEITAALARTTLEAVT